MSPHQRTPSRPPPKVLYPTPGTPSDEPGARPSQRVLGLERPRGRWRRFALPAAMLLAALGLIGWAIGLPRLGSPADDDGSEFQQLERRPADPPADPAGFVPPPLPPGGIPGDVAVDPESGLRLEIWSGNGQSGRVGRRLHNVLGVVLRDEAGLPVPNVPIVFRVATGGGDVRVTEPRTNPDGFASGAWRLGDDADSLLVSASVADRPALTVWFRATIAEGTSRVGIVAPPPRSRDARVDGTPSVAATPVQPTVPTPTAPARARVAAGGVHTCVLLSSNLPRCWGRAPEGASGSAARGTSPLAAVSSISTGVLDVCVVTVDTAVFCWRAGSPPSNGTRADLPANIAAVQVVAGADHRCALSSFGSVYCWGANTQGQLGNGTTADSDTTLRVPGLPTIATLAGGWLHTCALARSGAAHCWGSNASGQLGGGDVAGMGPMRVATSARLIAVSAGSAHTCALTDAGVALCWGANAAGQLGRDGNAVAREPVAVGADRPFVAIAAGGTHTCALDRDGGAWCWGGNAFGQLGDGTLETARAPRAVTGSKRFARIFAGGAHTCAETDAGELWCWGANLQGQLGDGSLGNQAEPVRIEVE